jgi:hypothetical protein
LSGCLLIVALLLILAGLMDTFAKGRPDVGVPIILAGVGIVVAINYAWERRRKRINSHFSSVSRPRFDSQGRFYCNACGGYVSRHDPANHPECN